MEPNPVTEEVRAEVIRAAKQFKTGWVDLGRVLFDVYKNKLFKAWGYDSFDGYIHKEISIKKPTALKLLRSYFFVEEHEPSYLTNCTEVNSSPSELPEYESLDILRKIKDSPALQPEDYVQVRESAFSGEKDATMIKKEVSSLLKQRAEEVGEDVAGTRSRAQIKRLVTGLKNLNRELAGQDLLTDELASELASLVDKIEVLV